MSWNHNILSVCSRHESADLFPAVAAEREWQHDALAVRATGAGLSVSVRRSADGKAACPRMETGLKKAQPDQIKPRSNQTETDRAGTRTGTSLSYLGQSSPSSGVISVSLCTTTLVTDMSGCCSLASFMAWARAYIWECSARRDHQGETEHGEGREGAGGCWIVSKYANREATFSYICHTFSICSSYIMSR